MIALHATLRAGPFSGWKDYRVTMAGNVDFRGLASTSKCYHFPSWQPLHPSEPIGDGAFINALVEVELADGYDPANPDHVVVRIQDDMDHHWIWVDKRSLVLRPQESLDELLARRVVGR